MRRKIHVAAVMHIEDNVISQPRIDVPSLWHCIGTEKGEERDNKRKNKAERRSHNTITTNQTQEEWNRRRKEEYRD
jgi:hypothetical protein